MTQAGDELEAKKVVERANRARDIIESDMFQYAIGKIVDYIDQKALSCDPDNKEMAQRIIISRQIAKSFEREFIKAIQNGEVAKTKIAEIEKARTFGQKVMMR